MATTTKKQPAKKKKPATRKKQPAASATKAVAVKNQKVADKKTAADKPATKRVRRNPGQEWFPTDKELRFCREYVCDYAMNATQAYLKAFPNTGYNTARTNSSKLLANSNIKRIIAQMQAERTERLSVTADKIMEEAVKLAFYDPRAFFDGDNRLVPVQNLDPDHAAVIEGVETLHKVVGDDNDGMAVTTKIKLPSKRGALEFLAKIKKMTSDSTPMQDKLTSDVLRRARLGEVTPLEGAYELQEAGLPIPEVLKLQLSRTQIDLNVENDSVGITDEEIERRAAARIAAVQQQRDEFLPQRRAEVVEIKEQLKDRDSFAPDKFEGAE